MQEGTLVQHKYVSLLSRVHKVDPQDEKKVVVQPLTGHKPFSASIDNLIVLGN